MTKEHWKKLLDQSINKFAVYCETPDGWKSVGKKSFENFVKEVDEATEVYFMENTKK